ncbi:hypothetical protein LPY66_17000 [Dehalobacter sp. DCM]|uniref:hypothetical protein n=1 Tax=Dehalobacter sp. DCM TaxID=2907827 RepID=UPI0030820C3E|nr:hypothetical protein LPY66_17000 [Dehalobacter sp. DCM]
MRRILTNDLKVAEDLVVKDVTTEKDITRVTVLSRGTPAMGLLIKGEEVKLLNAAKFTDEQPESQTPTAKTFQFQGRSEEMTLAVKGIIYTTISPESIEVPIQ